MKCQAASRVLFAAAALLSSVVSIQAQVLYGSLTGNIADSTGGALPAAQVEALNTGTGQKKQATTDERGAYLFNDLQPGTYAITISAPSFGTVIEKGVEIRANTIRRVDARLQVAQVNETITVGASATVLQTDRADVNSQITQAQITSLPLGGGRNFQNLYKIIPGFSPPTELHSDAGNPQRAMGTNVNGVSYSNNNTRLDGATVSYPWLPHIVAYVPPAEAVETVNVVSNSFDAEQGMAGGSAINVSIKSGSNDFHGSAHWFHTNSALRARNFFFLGSGLPKNLLNQAGGTIGGPIKRNKLFFFFDWERTVRRQYASALRTVPNAALRAGDFGGTGVNIYDPATGALDGSGRSVFPDNRIPSNRFDPAALKMIALIPQPNLAGTTNNYFSSDVYKFNRDNSDLKINYNATSNLAMFGRYSFSPSNLFDPPSLGPAGGDALNGGQPGTAPGRIQSAAIGGTYTLSPSILLDGNIGFTRQRLGAENVDIDKNYGLDVLNIPGTNGGDRLQGGYPRFTFITGGFSSIGNPNVSNPFLFRDQQFVEAGNMGWTKGAHAFRFGGEYSYYTINHFQPQTAYGPRGGFSFAGGGITALRGGTAPNLNNSFAEFLLGQADGLGKDLQFLNPDAVRMPSWGIYARDQWQITRKLTISYGMRYEYYPFATRDHRGGERYDLDLDKVLAGGLGSVPTDTGIDVGVGQIAPRIGFAYRVMEKTVVRAGFGISIDPNSFRYLRDAYPAVISLQVSPVNSFQPAGTLRTGIPAIPVPDLSQGIIDLPKNVGTQTFPQLYNRGYIESFNFTIQREIGSGGSVQAAYVGSRAIRQTANLNLNAGSPGGGTAGRALFARTGRTADIRSMAPFNTANYNSLQVQGTKRLGAGSSVGVAYTWSKSINYADNNDSGLTWNWVPMYARNRAVAGFDRTHNFQLYGAYELPLGRGKKFASSRLSSLLVGGWQANWLFSALTGTPFTVTSAGTSVDAPGNTQTADQVLPTVAIPGGIGRGSSYFDPNAFAPVTAPRFGNSGRNILRGPGLMNLDASIFRNFDLSERFRMQFRAESFNVTNTPAFNNPGAMVTSATRVNGVITNLGGYTEVTGAQATERQFRFALKLSF
ncbi:MAG TPA: TonB-dependent receptor [Bryobacteraceae bacterium]|nr:TonB-dependent receptor [Bryobacteraceae bacterium]